MYKLINYVIFFKDEVGFAINDKPRSFIEYNYLLFNENSIHIIIAIYTYYSCFYSFRINVPFYIG